MLFFAIALFCGCASSRSLTDQAGRLSEPQRNNPLFIPTSNHQGLWDAIEDVIDDYYMIAMTEPVRFHENIYTEGRIYTAPKMSASLLEPWHGDSVTYQDRLERTFQTIRSRSMVKVTPADSGFWVQVFVYTERENLSSPANSNISMADIKYDTGQDRIAQFVDYGEESGGWIFLGRDYKFEQKILSGISQRLRLAPSVVHAATREAGE